MPSTEYVVQWEHSETEHLVLIIPLPSIHQLVSDLGRKHIPPSPLTKKYIPLLGHRGPCKQLTSSKCHVNEQEQPLWSHEGLQLEGTQLAP